MNIPRELKGQARDFWKGNAPHLIADGRLTESTRFGFMLLCQNWARYQDAEADPDTHPNSIVALSKCVQSGMKEFGMSPLARRRLKLDQDEGPQDIGQAIQQAMRNAN